MTCRELMTPNPSYCVPRDTVVSAAMIMKSQDVGSIPVVSDRDSRRVIGIITDRDIAMRVVAEQREYYATHVEDVMSKDVVTCQSDDDYDEVLAAMKQHQIRRVPVVDSEKRLAGIIAQADVARDDANYKEVAKAVKQISQPGSSEGRNAGGGFTKTGLLVAGGLGLGAGLIYLLDPRWARGARQSVNDAASKVRDSVTNAADSVRESVVNAADSVRESVTGAADSLRETANRVTGSNAEQQPDRSTETVNR